MIRKGDRLRCVDPGGANYLTLGQIYIAQSDEYREGDQSYVRVILNTGGGPVCRYKYRFVKVPKIVRKLPQWF